jgi:hypothetical protein
VTSRRWLLLLIIAGLGLRAGLWISYEPMAFDDTPTYVTVARELLTADFSGYEGRRTPGYPVLIALGGLQPRNVWALQMLAGITISVLLFHIAFVMTKRPALAFAAGMSYNLNLAQLFFEANLLSETAGTLGIVAVTAATIDTHRRIREHRPVTAALAILAVLAGVTALTRPQFVFLPFLLGALVAYASLRADQPRVRAALTNSTIAVLPGILLLLGWCSFNYAKVGFFTLSTQTGIGLMDQSGAFVELAPDRYAKIRDIYVRHRDAKLAASGHSRHVIWEIVPELRAATGLSLPALSSELQHMSVGLFVRHPLRYARGVVHGWIDFWLAPNYWRLDRLTPVSLQPTLNAIWWVEHWVLRLGNAAFVVLLVLVVLSPAIRRRTGWDLDLSTIAAIVIFSATVQALAEYGENARFAIPIQGLVVLLLLIVGFRRAQARHTEGFI